MRASSDLLQSTDKASIEWLNSLDADTRKVYKSHWVRFLKFTGLTGDQILADRKADIETEAHKWEGKVLEFKRWMMETQHLGSNTARSAANAVRGFFSFHYKPIVLRPQQSKKLAESHRKTEDYKFSKEDLKKMADVGNLKEQYIVVAGKSFGLRASDFCNLSRGDLSPYIEREVPISIGSINTIKENVPAYPFIDSDAQPVIKLMLEQMTREGRTNPNEKMLKYRWEKELSEVLKRLAVRAGIETGNKRVRFHCLRKFLIDRLSSFMSESKWKQIVGKTIGEGAYVSADSLREDYIRAMAETTFVKVLPQAQIELLAKKQSLMIYAKIAGMTEDEMKAIFRTKKASTLQAEVSLLEEIAEAQRKEKEKVNGCADGDHCQRLVTEEQLEVMFAQGWRVVTCLPSGKIVVSNEH